MTTLPRERIRAKIDTSSQAEWTDEIIGAAPDFWRATDVQFEFGFFFGEDVLSIANISSITVNVKNAADRNGPLLASKTVAVADMDATLTAETWSNGSKQHCIVSLSAAETALEMNGSAEISLWVTIVAVTTDVVPRRIVMGVATLTMRDDGNTSATTPALGASLVPPGANYSGAGQYVLALDANKYYRWTKGANDTTCVNGTETLAATSDFIAQGGTVTLTGTPSQPVTATVRWPMYLTAEQNDARYLVNSAKIINDPGVNIGMQSPNGRWLRLMGVDDLGNRYDHVVDQNLL